MTSNSVKYEVTYEVMMSNLWLVYNISSLFGVALGKEIYTNVQEAIWFIA